VTRSDKLPDPPEGKVRVIDDAEPLYTVLTIDGVELVYEVNKSHLVDSDEFG
jgi:hypothetical protein